jgi:hypothetical protein
VGVEPGRRFLVRRSTRELIVRVVIAVGALLFAGSGVWAFAAPQSFYDVIATYPPYNAHFIRDIGAFLFGLGAMLVGALAWRDVRLVVLLGGTVAAGLHWASHVIDHDHGGRAADPWLTGAFALLILTGLVAQLTTRNAETQALAQDELSTSDEGAGR